MLAQLAPDPRHEDLEARRAGARVAPEQLDDLGAGDEAAGARGEQLEERPLPRGERDLRLVGLEVGRLEVYYREPFPPADEGPFLKEERRWSGGRYHPMVSRSCTRSDHRPC